jgi:hypothetical protein
MPRVAIIAAITLAGCLCSAISHAEICRGPSAPTTFPEPATASDADILAAQQDVKKYLADTEQTLKCLSATHNDAGYNHAVEDMQRIAAAFNGVLRAYRAARQQKS